MQEELTLNRKVKIQMERLKAIVGNKYEIRKDEFNQVEINALYEVTKEETSMFGMKYMTSDVERKPMACICKLGEPRDRSSITVYSEEIYREMKQFGNEFGFRTLQKDWDGSEKEGGMQEQKPQRKMEEVTMKPRYEQLGEKK